MKAAAFEYARADSLAEAIKVLCSATEAGQDAQVVAGGQSLLAMMNLRVSSPDLLVDISRIEQLRVVLDESDAIRIGACVTHAAIEDRAMADPSRGLMPMVAGNLAYRAVRTRGTLGGSLALSDPAGDWVTVMQAIGARVGLVGDKGRREVEALGFTTGLYETARAPNEIMKRPHSKAVRCGALGLLEILPKVRRVCPLDCCRGDRPGARLCPHRAGWIRRSAEVPGARIAELAAARRVSIGRAGRRRRFSKQG